jgi:hypothetical protein
MYEEEWTEILGFPNYMVSTHGRIRNIKHERLVKMSLTKQGAVKVSLYSENIRVTKSVKVLVAESFLPGRTDQFDTALHLDGNQSNNYIENLVWRPRWFAWKYSRQFDYFDQYSKLGPVFEIRSKVTYLNIAEAGIKNGLLFNEIDFGITNKVAVFPTWQQFEWKQ